MALAAAALVWIVMGFLVESMSSRVEVYGIDRRRDDHAQLVETWWLYLRSAWDNGRLSATSRAAVRSTAARSC